MTVIVIEKAPEYHSRIFYGILPNLPIEIVCLLKLGKLADVVILIRTCVCCCLGHEAALERVASRVCITACFVYIAILADA